MPERTLEILSNFDNNLKLKMIKKTNEQKAHGDLIQRAGQKHYVQEKHKRDEVVGAFRPEPKPNLEVEQLMEKKFEWLTKTDIDFFSAIKE